MIMRDLSYDKTFRPNPEKISGFLLHKHFITCIDFLCQMAFCFSLILNTADDRMTERDLSEDITLFEKPY